MRDVESRIEITPAPVERIDEVMRLYATFDRPPDPWTSTGVARRTLQRIRNQGGEVFVALVGDAIVGTYAVYVCENLTRGGRPFAVVENVICAPNHRRQGIGTALMEHAQAHARSRGCYKISLQSGAGRDVNRSFYESCGFSCDKWGYQIRFDSQGEGAAGAGPASPSMEQRI
jgi:GNAT superfamily N-acetyltransferase